MKKNVKTFHKLKTIINLFHFSAILFFLFFFKYFSFSLFLKIKKISSLPVQVFFYSSFLFLSISIIRFIFCYLSDYFLEKKFNLLKQSFSSWVKDFLKERLIEFFIFIIFVELLFFLLKLTSFWWIYLGIICFFLIFLLSHLTSYLLSLFFPLYPLKDEELKNKLKRLAEKFSLNIKEFWIAKFSQKTERVNALVAEKNKVYLADNIINGFTPSEIEVICAHEFAHIKNKDIFKVIILEGFFYIFLFFLLHQTFQILKEKIVLYRLPLFLFFLLIYAFFLTPLKNIFLRNIEKGADRLALIKTEDVNSFISCMEKLARKNLAERNPFWYRKIFMTHPTIEERINLAKRCFQKEENI